MLAIALRIDVAEHLSWLVGRYKRRLARVVKNKIINDNRYDNHILRLFYH
jgi:hypothetical protein